MPARSSAKFSESPWKKKISATPAFDVIAGFIHPPGAPGPGAANASSTTAAIPATNQFFFSHARAPLILLSLFV